MGTTQPIKEISQIEELKEFYKKENPNYRNYAMICLGINSALRISELVMLRWGQVYDFRRGQYKKHISLTEQKTRKKTRIAINEGAMAGLELYRKSLKAVDEETYNFSGKIWGQDAVKPLSGLPDHKKCSRRTAF